MVTRLGRWLRQFFIALDQLVFVWLAGWLYVWAGRGECPSADETISSFVGRHAIEGQKWALIAEKVINALFRGTPNHCRKSIEWDEAS